MIKTLGYFTENHPKTLVSLETTNLHLISVIPHRKFTIPFNLKKNVKPNLNIRCMLTAKHS